MAAVAPEFVEALQRTSTATVPGYTGQSMGVPLAFSAGMKQVGAVSVALLVLISGCVLLNYVGRASTVGMFMQHAGRLHAHAKSLHNKVVAEAQKRLADPEPEETENKAANEKGAESEPSSVPTAGPAEKHFAASESSFLDEAIAATAP